VIYFDEYSLDSSDFRALAVGDWVDYEEQCWGERIRAVKGQANLVGGIQKRAIN
jgi:hypothetical protein